MRWFYFRQNAYLTSERNAGLAYSFYTGTITVPGYCTIPVTEVYQTSKLNDAWGMLLACGLLERTLDPGRNSITVQYSTARRLQAALTNYAFTTEEGGGSATVLSDRYKQRFSGGPTSTLFYEPFSLGCHEQMGDMIQKDQALTIKVLEALLGMAELDASSGTISAKERYEAILLGSALMIWYSTGLRGEELALCKLDPTISETSMLMKIPGKPFLTLVLEGSFKGGQREEAASLHPRPHVFLGGAAQPHLATAAGGRAHERRGAAEGTVVLLEAG
jgi:hypothetical protein